VRDADARAFANLMRHLRQKDADRNTVIMVQVENEVGVIPWPGYPDPLTLKNGQNVTTADMWWKQRRPEIVADFENEVYGRVPKDVPKVTWTVKAVDTASRYLQNHRLLLSSPGDGGKIRPAYLGQYGGGGDDEVCVGLKTDLSLSWESRRGRVCGAVCCTPFG
jgi:hypothetical protein